MRESFSLYELQRIVSAAVEQFLPQPVWVSAEIAELKVNNSGHCYIELVEKDENSSSGTQAKAQAKAVIWRSRFPSLASKFERDTGRQMCATMKVLVQVAISYHPVYGMSLQIVDIDPTYTIGEAERLRQQTIANLKAQGLWDTNRAVPVAKVVQRVAVISSATAAGYRDFMQEITASPYRIETTLFEAVMQGEKSEQSISEVFEVIVLRKDEFDAVAIIRGGGSASDLECFNSYTIAACVAKSPLPVITGIGHDKDISIVDMVAAIPLKTPTAVAAWICSTAERFDGQLEYAALLLRESCHKITQGAQIRLQQFAQQLKNGATTALAKQSHKLDAYALLAENFAPTRVLKLGFAIARGKGCIIRSIDQIECGEHIDIEVANGSFTAQVVKKYDKEE